jgi:hypothetical protein
MSHWNRAALRQVLVERMSDVELRVIAFDLDITVPGTVSHDDMAISIIRHLDVRQELDRLIEWIEAHRKDIYTGALLVTEGQPQSLTTNATALFDAATRARILGDLEKALTLYRQVKEIDPLFPRIHRMIEAVEREMKRRYVDDDGRVRPRIILSRPDEVWGNAPPPPMSAAPLWLRLLPIAGAIVILALSGLIYVWFGVWFGVWSALLFIVGLAVLLYVWLRNR